jgi:hypothetical protein
MVKFFEFDIFYASTLLEIFYMTRKDLRKSHKFLRAHKVAKYSYLKEFVDFEAFSNASDYHNDEWQNKEQNDKNNNENDNNDDGNDTTSALFKTLISESKGSTFILSSPLWSLPCFGR